jgi:cell division transport system permease protein
MWTRVTYFWRETMISLRRNVLMTIAGILTVTISLALFGGILLLSKWVDHGTEKVKGGVTLEIFMKVDATDPQIEAIRKSLDADKGPRGTVKSFRFLTKADAYVEFKRIFRRDPDLVQSIAAKDLPPSFRVAPVRAELTDTVRQEFQDQEGVDKVTTPGQALKGLIGAISTARWIFIVLSLVLLTSSLFLIVNTIRIATFARRREIEVMKLVGASNWFVRVPFMAEGLLQGLAGAGVAAGLVIALKRLGFDSWFNNRNNFFSEFFVTNSDAVLIGFYVLVLGAIVGTIGATIGLRRFLRT